MILLNMNKVFSLKTNKQTNKQANKEEYTFMVCMNSPVLQSARPRAVALASYTGVDKIINNTVGFTPKDIWID